MYSFHQPVRYIPGVCRVRWNAVGEHDDNFLGVWSPTMLGLKRDSVCMIESLVRISLPRMVDDFMDTAHHARYSWVGIQVKLVVDCCWKRDNAELGGVWSDVELVDEVFHKLDLLLKVGGPFTAGWVQQKHDVQLRIASCKSQWFNTSCRIYFSEGLDMIIFKILTRNF